MRPCGCSMLYGQRSDAPFEHSTRNPFCASKFVALRARIAVFTRHFPAALRLVTAGRQ